MTFVEQVGNSGEHKNVVRLYMEKIKRLELFLDSSIKGNKNVSVTTSSVREGLRRISVL